MPVKAIIHNDVIPGDFTETPSFTDVLTRPTAYAEH
jgi:hypothetical protein